MPSIGSVVSTDPCSMVPSTQELPTCSPIPKLASCWPISATPTGIVREANAVIDGKDAHIAALEAMLVREQLKNAGLVRERGQARNAVLAARLAGRH